MEHEFSIRAEYTKLQTENAALKEQVAQLEISKSIFWWPEVKAKLEQDQETITQQQAKITTLVDALEAYTDEVTTMQEWLKMRHEALAAVKGEK